MLLYILKSDGGFLCGDTEMGVAAYAYPSSVHAETAKRHPAAVAASMLNGAQMALACVATHPDLAERNECWLCELRASSAVSRGA